MNVVEMRGITKRFGNFTANDDINLIVQKGEIHALLGENGAGKSTLMNILFGLYQPDEGEIFIHEKKVEISGPTMANELGIGMVHQHFMLVQPFTVTENIILGVEETSGGFIQYEKARKKVQKLSEQYGLKIDADAVVEDISVGMQQRVEILKTLYRGAEILIFDEPTAVLTPQEIEELIMIMRNLIREGKTIIFISHKLKEIMTACNRVTVIRRGKIAKTVEIKETSEKNLAALMVGREVSFEMRKEEQKKGSVALQVKNLSVKGFHGKMAVDHLSLDVHKGEVVGLAGVDGNGQSELIEAITGLKKIEQGRIYLNEVDITKFKTRKIIETGVGHIPEDRHKRGLVLDFTVSENMILSTYYKAPFANTWGINDSEVVKYAERLVKEFDVRTPSIETPMRALSGGNQQKAIISREVDRDPDLLIAAQPTRGLDVGAIEFIHRRIMEQRDKGKAVLLVSLELNEILKLSDRVAIIYEGKIQGWVDPKIVTEEELGLLMTGSRSSGGDVK
jgi:simple sugar transport system ATP-binding protein